MIFKDQGSRAYDSYNKKKRQTNVQKWPDTNGIPYIIYKAQSNYSYKSFFCKIFILFIFINKLLYFNYKNSLF